MTLTLNSPSQVPTAFRPRARLVCSGGNKRAGAAAVEFALIAPVLFAVILGMFEFGRALMVSEILNSAVRSGCRAGTLPGASNTNINTAITNNLAGITGTTTTILVNGSAADVSTSISGDLITVQLSVPYSSVTWVRVPTYLGSATLSASAVMSRE